MIPTHGWMPWRNSRNYAESLDVVGGLTRSVADTIFLMRGLTGDSRYDPDATLEGDLMVGLYRTADWDKAPSTPATVTRRPSGGSRTAAASLVTLRCPRRTRSWSRRWKRSAIMSARAPSSGR